LLRPSISERHKRLEFLLINHNEGEKRQEKQKPCTRRSIEFGYGACSFSNKEHAP
jgi:hypothetical protein